LPPARDSEESGEDLLTLMMKSSTVALLLALQLASTPAFTPQQSNDTVR
jgi:hypothetical protein